MKKIILYILVLLFVAPLIMWGFWFFKKPRILNVFVLDKTSITQDENEHLSLFWVLQNEKFYHSKTKAYNLEKDFFGFFVDEGGKFHIKDLENFNEDTLNILANEYDVAFYTDLYGIDKQDWIETYFANKREIPPSLRNAKNKIYGGLSANDLAFLRMMKQKRKLIINEFNNLAPPTSPEIRKNYEKEFNIYWSGWIGRYFERLDSVNNTDLPKWMVSMYMKQNQNQWPFKKSGIVLIKNENEIVILEDSVHLRNNHPYILTTKRIAEVLNIEEKVPYPFWFDIIEAKDKAKPLSKFYIDVNQRGDNLLKSYNIPKIFPAVTYMKDKFTFYYFSGDFSDNPVTLLSAQFSNIDKLTFTIDPNDTNSRINFFFRFYRPLIQHILTTEYENIIKN